MQTDRVELYLKRRKGSKRVSVERTGRKPLYKAAWEIRTDRKDSIKNLNKTQNTTVEIFFRQNAVKRDLNFRTLLLFSSVLWRKKKG